MMMMIIMNVNILMHVTSQLSHSGQDWLVAKVTKLRIGRPRNRGLVPARDKRLFCYKKRPYQHGSPTNLLFDEYRNLFSQGQSGRGVRLTSRVHLMSRLSVSGAIGYFHFLICLHDVHMAYFTLLYFSSRGVSLTSHAHLAPRLKKEYSCTRTPHLGLHGLF
jgi:hypothetical protein